MNWKKKARLHSTLSRVPGGDEVNYLLQRYVTKSLPASEKQFRRRFTIAQRHVRWVLDSGLNLNKGLFFEFGAGRDLMGPLSFYAQGVEHQIVVDLNKLIKPQLINSNISHFTRFGDEFTLHRRPCRLVGGSRQSFIAQLHDHYGIDYRAPADARNTGLPPNSVSCISSSRTMEHISPADLLSILKECRRILTPNGLMTFQIDYQDHYSYFDSSISVYNFLRYSDAKWQQYSPSMQFQNRLRHRDYLNLFNEANLKVLREECHHGSDQDHRTLMELPLDLKFRDYSLPELGIRGSHVLLVKE